MWREKGTNRQYDFDLDKMKKADYNIKGCRLPVALGPGEVFLYRDCWEDDGESYIICDKNFLKEVK